MHWKRSSIHLKLYAAFTALSLLAALFVIVAALFQLRTAERAALLETRHVAESIARTGIQDPLANKEVLQRHLRDIDRFGTRDLFVLGPDRRIVADVNHPEDVGKVYAADLNGEIGLTMRDRQPRSFIEVDPLQKAAMKQFVVPFNAGDGAAADAMAGVLVLEYTQIHDELMSDALLLIYIMAALGALFVFSSAYLGYRTVAGIARPLIDLKRGVVRLAAGDFKAKVSIPQSDEIGELAAAFNTMSEDIRANHARLVEYQAELERRVEARTGELRQTNIRLSEEVEEHKRAQEQLTYLAQYDSLTRLANRHMLHDRLSQALAAARISGETVGCIFIDLDHFKAINDSYGHSVGDELLMQAAARLRQCVRGSDIIGRLGGDEFAVVLPNLARAEDAGRVAQKVVDAMSGCFVLRGRESYVTASMGIALFPQDGDEAELLLKNADLAMYRAKHDGRNTFKFYAPAMNDQAARRLSIETDLRGALERREFLLHYQPKVELASGHIVGFEALLRWRHPERGLVSPAEFIPILEDNGLIVPVGEWTLQAVCTQVRAWKAAGITPLPIAINLSARQFQQADFDRRVSDILEENGVEHRLAAFEITESMLMHDPAEAARVIGKLKQIGVKLSVDDFGTGYSSLAYLRRFPLDELKIDQSFIREATADPSNTAIILAIINLAHNLKLRVVAEGVETEAQAKFLRARGCDEMQGYYFSKPLPAEECGPLMAENRRLNLSPDDHSGGVRVLIVDDSKTDLELVQRALRPDGYLIHAATDPQAALQTLMRQGVDVVITDHDMPGMSGVAFMAAVRNLHPRALRIVMSGHGSADMISDAVNAAGVHKYMSKSWEAARMRAEVREALRKYADPAVAAQGETH